MKHLLLWISICLLVPLTLIATQGHTSPTSAATPAPTPAAITPTVVVPISTTVRAADGMVMVYVPAGEFLMGSPIGEGDYIEWPQHTVYLDGFWIDQTEVTNRQFEKFVQATGYRTDAEKIGSAMVWAQHPGWPASVQRADWRHPEGPDSSIAGRENEPMLQTAWVDAQAYCQWAGGRLPTEAEWEKTACGTDGRRYPWGNQEASCTYGVITDQSGPGCGKGDKPWPVGSKPEGASPYGALDLGGNANEWVFDWHDDRYYERSPASNPQGPDTGFYRECRDYSWRDDSLSAYSPCRWRGPGMFIDDLGGFRCAVSVPTPAAPAEIATTPAPGPVSRVLFIGDSDSWFLDRYLPRLAASGNAPVAIESKALAATPRVLLAAYTVSSYPLREIHSGNWDVIVLQQDLDKTWSAADRFCKDVRNFSEAVKKAGAKTILYMPWDNAAIPPPPTLQETADVYTKCGAELGVKVAPVGLAFQRAMKQQPAMSLHIADGTHANQRGLYLALSVLYATIYERSPVGLTYRMDDVAPTTVEYALWGLDKQKDWQLTDDEATFLQQVAWETVQDYQAGK